MPDVRSWPTPAIVPPDRRAAAISSAIGVLHRLGDAAARQAVEIRQALEEKKEPDPKLIRLVETALLVAIMSPNLKDEDAGALEKKELPMTVSGVFRRPPALPTRQHIHRVYTEFGAAFSDASKRDALPNPP